MSTYLRRRGRLTRAQARAIARLGPTVILDQDSPLEPTRAFGREGPLGLEIGFGAGQALLDWAQAAPEWNLLGIEVYEPGIGSLLKGMAERELGNIRVIADDASDVLQTLLPQEGLSEVRIFFPDPWPKTRHHKRRLINPEFVSMLAGRMRPAGRLRLATDWQPYAVQMLSVLEAESSLENAFGEDYAPRFEGRPVTRFEARGRRLGHGVWDLCYLKR